MRFLSSFPLIPLALLLVLNSCASGGVSRLDAPPRMEAVSAAASRPFPPSHLITGEELEPLADRSLLDAIRRLRPAMLRPDKPVPGAQGELPAIYLDGVFLGGPEVLDRFSPLGVREVRRMRETEAFASGTRRHPAGVIMVRTRS